MDFAAPHPDPLPIECRNGERERCAPSPTMTAGRSDFDAHMMGIALRLARRGLGQTAPNPSVGAVIADDAAGEIIARAVTAQGGRPHAETIAIAAAGARARGATLYVTLEPCSHHGQTGPCVDAIISTGLKRVAVGIEDPDPRVAGRGLDKLRAAGIEVQRGAGAVEARWITRGHIVRVTERRPFVTLKLALQPDGDVPRGRDGIALMVTGDAANARGHLMRAQSDAILVGATTVTDDDPKLTCRLPGLTKRSPVRVVLSRGLDISTQSKLAKTAGCVPVWVMCGGGADHSRREALTTCGVDVIDVTEVGGALWLPAVMEALVARGITRLLVEGGPRVWRAFADAALVDEVALFMTGAAASRNDDPALAAAQRWLGPVPLTLEGSDVLDADRLWRFRRTLMKEGR